MSIELLDQQVRLPTAASAPARGYGGVVGRLLYGALFVVALPAALALWASRLDTLHALPVVEHTLFGSIIAIAGALVMIATTMALWIFGGGLPMSAYPPSRFVTRWTYRYLANPMYVGAVLVSLGLSIALGSAAGLWIVTPTLTLAIAAWVLGFERDVTRAHFGDAMRPPLLRLPDAGDARPSAWNRVSAYALVALPWLVLHAGVTALGTGVPIVESRTVWDRALTAIPWTEAVFQLSIPLALLAPIVAASRSDLRWLMTRGWIATAITIPFYLIVPVGSVAAFPSFVVVWTLLAAAVYTRRWPRLTALWWTLALAIAASAVTSGAHALLDVVGALAAYVIVVRAERVWEWLRGRAERLANSWHELTLGPVRLINHGIYAAVGAWAGLATATALAGSEVLWALVVVAASSIVGAALWAQLVEGSPQLLRPYGYYGSIAGAVLAIVALGIAGVDAWLVAAAMSIGCSITQAVGRGRCLVQGCCHGRECSEELGIHYRHPRSRVTRLSTLGGRPLHPTQLYSAAWMLLVAAILVRLWTLHAGLELITGLYFLLVGLGRFVEEHFRGEPQTAVRGGLRLYQWLSILFAVGGAAITCVGWTPAPAITIPTLEAMGLLALFAVGAYVAYGVDFPRLNARFSRLV